MAGIDLGAVTFVFFCVLVLATTVAWIVTVVIGNYFAYSFHKKFGDVESSISHLNKNTTHPSKFFFMFSNECRAIIENDASMIQLRHRYIISAMISILLPCIILVMAALAAVLVNKGVI